MVARLSRLIALAPVLVATLLLSGCAFVQAVTQRVGMKDSAPEVEVRPATNQVDDLLGELRTRAAKGDRKSVV